MNLRTTYILLGIVGLALASLAVYVATTSNDDPPPSVEGYLLKKLRAATVTASKVSGLEIETPGRTPEKIVLARDSRSWRIESPSRARADSSQIDRLVDALLNAKVEKGADISPNLADHGLDSPPVRVTIRAGNVSETVSLGNLTIGGTEAVVYVLTEDKPNKAQAARRSDFAPLFKAEPPKGKSATNAGQLVKSAADFRPTVLIGDDLPDLPNQVVSMAVRRGKDELALFRMPPSYTWTFREPKGFGDVAVEPAPGGPKDTRGVTNLRELLNQIVAIRPASNQQFIENPGDLSQYGLDRAKNNPVQIDFSREGGVQETIYVGGPIKSGTDEKFYAKNEADATVAEVPAGPVKKVLETLENKQALRDRTVLKVQPQRVDAVDVTVNGETFELRRPDVGWTVYGPGGKGRLGRTEAVGQLVNQLTTPQLAVGFPVAGLSDDKMGFTKPTVEIKFWEGGIVKDAKADPKAKPKLPGPPTARLLFGGKDVGDAVYVRRIVGDAKADFFVPFEVFRTASRGRLEYLDTGNSRYGADSVTKFSFTHGKDVYELTRAPDDKAVAKATWTIQSPAHLKGTTADARKVSEMLTDLAILQPRRVATDATSDETLNRLKLNPASPRMKVTVTTKDSLLKDQPEKQRIFLFGDDVPTDKTAIYYKPADVDLVFEGDRAAFELFQKANLQDMAVHRIDEAKVSAIKITGWADAGKAPVTLELERKAGAWTVKAGGKFEIDPRKLGVLLRDLTAPEAESFVVRKTGPKPEHNLDVAKGAMSIELAVDGLKDPVKLVLSAPNKAGRIFGTSSLAPGDVFAMVDRFAIVRAKPESLKKD